MAVVVLRSSVARVPWCVVSCVVGNGATAGVTLRNTATIPALSPLAGKVPGIAPMLNGPVGLDYLGYASAAGLLLRNLTVHDTQRRAWLQLNPHWDADSIVGNVRVIQPSCFANSSKPLPNLKVQCQPPKKMKSDDAPPIVLHVAAAGPRHLKSDDREVALFVCCDIAAGGWGRHLQAIRRHVSNLTTVIVAPYELSSNATLVNQGSHAQDALSAAAQMRAELNLRTTALVACSPSGIRRAIYDSAAAQALVRAAVTQAVRTGIDGYNLDAEFAGDQNATDGARFVAFLNLFADALHAVNRTLSVDVHGDGSRPFDFHVWGSAYKASRVDRIVTMATYTDAKRNFDKYFAEAVYQVGPAKIQPGMEPNAVLANPLDTGYIRSKNVSSIAVWGPTPGALGQAHWDSMGAFLQEHGV